MTMPYRFRAATAFDLPKLLAWQQTPHVAEWWDSIEPEDEDDLADPRVARWVVQHQGRDFAYIQDYTPHGWEGHYFAHLPEGSRGIDQFIGDPAMTGQGHGPAFIKHHIKALFSAGAPAIATDPHPDNLRAISAYHKAGFRRTGAALDTQWGMILPMVVMP